MKKQLILGLVLLFCTTAYAQEDGHYFYLNAGSGFHNLSYGLKDGSEKGGLGYSFNGGYSYFLNNHLGLQTGLGLRTIRPLATLNYNTVTPLVDDDGENNDFRTNYSNWKEKQQLLFLDIPLGLQYRFGSNEKLRFLASAGMKVSFPLKTKYQTDGGNIVTSGYYSQWNVELKDMPRHGFTTITDLPKGNVSIKPSYGGFAELGALYRLSDRLDLYVGGYLDYGLNNVARSSDKPLYQPDGVYNGVLASNQKDRAKLISFGLKLGVQWHFKSREAVELSAERAQVVVTPPVVEKPVVEKPFVEKPQVKIFEQPVVVEKPAPKAEVAKTEIAKPEVKKAPVAKAEKKETPYARARELAESIKVYFDFESSKPSDSEDLKISELSKILKANHSIILHVVGHTDNLGSQKLNKKLGLQRAIAVKQKFVNKGVRSAQLHTEVKALDTANDKRSLNRVVTLAVK